MKAKVKQVGAATVVALLLSVSGLAGLTNCVAYISSGAEDKPLTGWLTGESTVTKTTTHSYTGGWTYKFFGGNYSYTSTIAESYTVGSYKMSDGTTQQLRCDTYQYV